MTNEVLNQLYQKNITPKEAYKQLFDHPKMPHRRRAHWVKIRIVVPDDRKATRWMAFLFGLPIPLFLARIGLRFAKLDKEDIPFDQKQMMDLISTKGILVNVTSQDGTIVFIKTI
jgi:hypothetical protein